MPWRVVVVSSSAGKRGRPSLSYAQRLHDPKDFQNVYAAQTAVHAPAVVVFYRPNGLAESRLGVSVGSKHGGAVVRNRIKRVLRAAFRECRYLFPSGFDYVLVPRKGSKELSDSASLKKALETVAGKLRKKDEHGKGAGAERGEKNG